MKLLLAFYLATLAWAGTAIAQTDGSVTDAVQNSKLIQHEITLERNARAIEELRTKIYDISDSLSQLKAIGAVLGALGGTQLALTWKKRQP